jgi:hypothetical protein
MKTLTKISISDIALIGGGAFILGVSIDTLIYVLNGGVMHGCVYL